MSSSSSSSDSSKLGPDEFVVERIIDKRFSKKLGKDEYYVKWWDYPDSENTWEPIESFTNNVGMLDDFEKEFASRQKNAKKRLSEPSQPQPHMQSPANKGMAGRPSGSTGHQSASKSASKAISGAQPKPKKRAVIESGESSGEEERSSSKASEKVESASSNDEAVNRKGSPGPSNLKKKLSEMSVSLDHPELEPEDDPNCPFDPTNFTIKIPAAHEEDGFDRGWEVERLIDIRVEEQTIGKQKRQMNFVVVKFKGFRYAQQLPLKRVEEQVDHKTFVDFLREKFRKSSQQPTS